MSKVDKPRLFGINNSNRDFTDPNTWGKNQFNSSFPAALACYMFSKSVKAVYLKSDEQMNVKHDYISIKDVFNIDPLDNDAFYAFETQFTPYQRYVVGSIPRNDLVIQNLSNNQCVGTVEIKLTALPDNATCDLKEDEFGSEIVVRPDTIVYLACSIIKLFSSKEELANYFDDNKLAIKDWTQAKYVLPIIKIIKDTIKRIVKAKNNEQSPLILEPIWKTNGKSPQLSDDCLDIFVWSNFGMLNLFMPEEDTLTNISRHTRSMVWLFKMLYDYSKKGKFDGEKIIDELSYNTKNDKAFSTNGSRTHVLMKCSELTKPRINKNEIKKIILGGGQNLLSPERRFDAIIYNSPDLFKEE